MCIAMRLSICCRPEICAARCAVHVQVCREKIGAPFITLQSKSPIRKNCTPNRWRRQKKNKPTAVIFLSQQTDSMATAEEKAEIEEQIRHVLPRQPIELNCRVLTGQSIALRVTAAHTIRHLKYLIMLSEGVPICQQRLVYASRDLEDDRTIESYNIPAESTVFLILRLAGC